ncbi:MAG TPA: hypothetical protein VLO11_14430 [Luteolibacter sp.]|nr:hypothetical protein [Luteolibacter sp.]
MKTIPCIMWALAGLASPVWAQQPGQMRDAATHDQLAQTYRQFAQQNPMRNMKPAEGVDPSTVNRPKDIISESDIICFNGLATLVPKRAILTLPASMKDRLEFKPGSKLIGWLDFYAANRGWITTVEVSRVQAEGNEAFDEQLSERIGKSRNLVVATHLGGPIGVLPLKVPEEAKAAETETAQAR